MRILRQMKGVIVATTVLASLGASCNALAEPSAIYLVRHAEKGSVGQDPDLAPQGRERARNIAAILGKTGITAIFSTETARTRQTAAPLAQRTGVTVQSYDAHKQQVLVDKIKALNGAVLVVGHSNTLPELVHLLGGAPGTDIGEDEYDRLYQLLPGPDGKMKTILLGTPPMKDKSL